MLSVEGDHGQSLCGLFKKPVFHNVKTHLIKTNLSDIMLPVLEHYLRNAKGLILFPVSIT